MEISYLSKYVFILLELIFSITAELPELLASLGIGGLKARKICVDANAGFCDHCQETQELHQKASRNGSCEVYIVFRQPSMKGLHFKRRNDCLF